MKAVDLERRRFLEGAALAALTMSGGASVVERYHLRLEHVPVQIPRLPPGLEGLRIALLTDLHIGRWAKPDLAERAVALAARGRPDLAILGGDLAHDDITTPELVAMAGALSRLQPPLGTYAILGNHDYLASASRVANALADAGLQVLINAGHPLTVRGAQLWVAGLDDAWYGRPDLRAALAGAPGDSIRLLAMHEPDYADELVRVAGGAPLHLQLSGHSHGGQIRLPFYGPVIIPKLADKYVMGLYQVGQSGLQVYTSRGIGVTGPPVRLNCPPEVTILELRGGTLAGTSA